MTAGRRFIEVQHELAEQRALGDERNEREGAEPLLAEQAMKRGEGFVGGVRGLHHRRQKQHAAKRQQQPLVLVALKA